MAAVALYQQSSGRGQLSVWALETPPERATMAPPRSTIQQQQPRVEVMASPNKADEKSLASTVATTPESQVSRQTNQEQSDSKDKQATDRSSMNPPEPTDEHSPNAMCVEPSRLDHRFPRGPEEPVENPSKNKDESPSQDDRAGANIISKPSNGIKKKQPPSGQNPVGTKQIGTSNIPSQNEENNISHAQTETKTNGIVVETVSTPKEFNIATSNTCLMLSTNLTALAI